MSDYRVIVWHPLGGGRGVWELVLVTPLAELAENARRQHAAFGVIVVLEPGESAENIQ